jgi:diacylglycerol kinase (ATP)
VSDRRVVVIFNADAGRKAGLPTNTIDEDAIRTAMREHGLGEDLFLSASKAEADARIDRAMHDGADVVAAAGGDGTVHSVAFRLMGTATALGILPGGSAMNVGRSLGIPRELDPAMALLASGPIRAIDVGEAAGKPFLEMASIGLNADIFEVAEHAEGGRPGELISVIREAVRMRPTRLRLELDGREVRTRALGLAVAIGPYAGVGISVAPEARLDDGRFDVVVFEGFRRLELLMHLMGALGGRRPDRRLTTYRAAHVRVTTRRPLPVRVDSDDAGTTPIDLSVKRGQLRVVAPGRKPAPS